jgi:hypothetical protein
MSDTRSSRLNLLQRCRLSLQHRSEKRWAYE